MARAGPATTRTLRPDARCIRRGVARLPAASQPPAVRRRGNILMYNIIPAHINNAITLL